MRSKLGRNVRGTAIGVAALALLGVWLWPHGPADAQENKPFAPRSAYFYFDAESGVNGAALPNPPFWYGHNNEAKRGKIAADPTALQGKNVLRWDAKDKEHDLFNEIKFDRVPEAKLKDYYYAFFVRYDRIDGKDIWHAGKDESSADKGFEIVGDGIRWIVSFGSWGHTNEKQRFTTWVGNPTHHLNRKLEVYDAYYPNQAGFSAKKPIPMEYEKWHAIVFKMKWATDDTGEVALWVNGEKILEYTGIKTAKAPGTFERLQIFGTIAQPAYDAPPHVRKVDALLFTDDWKDIEDGGYLRDPQEKSKTTNPPKR